MDYLPPHLSFTRIENDPDFLGFAVEVRAEGFAGATEAWMSRGDLDRFLDELDALDSSLRGEARLTCAWVKVGQPPSLDDTDLKLVVRPYGHAGRLQADVTVRASSRWTRRHTAHIVFELPEPNALTRFRRALREAAGDPSAAPAVLSPAFNVAGV
jgi:hypothetical protein